MKKYTLIALLACIIFHLSAQQVEWAKSEPFPSYVTQINNVIHDDSGNTFISGHSKLGTDDYRIFIVKYDFAGSKLWEKKYQDGNYVGSLCTDTAGNLYTYMFATYVEGDTFNYHKGPLFAKYSKNGNLLWIKQVSYSIWMWEKTDHQNNIIAGGHFEDTLYLDNNITLSSNDSLYGSYFIARYNTNGECIWAIQEEGSNRPPTCNAQGEMVFRGELMGDTRTIGKGANQVTLYPDTNGGVYVAKYFSDGTLAWANQKLIGLITLDEYGNAYTMEYDQSVPKTGFITKYDPAGNLLWKRTSLYLDEVYKCQIACGSNGDLFISGGFFNYMTIEDTTIYTNNLFHTFIAKLDSSGALKWITINSGSGWSGAKDIAVFNGNEIYVTGDMGGQNIFGSHSVSEQAGVFTVKILDLENNPSPVSSSTIMERKENELLIFPNPAGKTFTVNFSSSLKAELFVGVKNELGQCICSETKNNFQGEYTNTINLSKQPPGVYFVEVVCGEERITKKIVIE